MDSSLPKPKEYSFQTKSKPDALGILTKLSLDYPGLHHYIPPSSLTSKEGFDDRTKAPFYVTRVSAYSWLPHSATVEESMIVKNRPSTEVATSFFSSSNPGYVVTNVTPSGSGKDPVTGSTTWSFNFTITRPPSWMIGRIESGQAQAQARERPSGGARTTATSSRFAPPPPPQLSSGPSSSGPRPPPPFAMYGRGNGPPPPPPAGDRGRPRDRNGAPPPPPPGPGRA